MKPSPFTQPVVPALVFFAIAVFLPLGCNKKEATPTPEVAVQAVHPTQGSISEQITADATLAPLAQAAISPKITAPVKKFYVQRGSHVQAGKLLVTLENSDLEAAALDNKGVYTAAQGAYATETRAQVPANLTKAQTDLAQAKANLDLSQSIVNARSQLFTQGAIPGRDLDTAKAAVVQAQSAYDIAKQNLEAIQQVAGNAELQSAQGQLTSATGKYLGAQAQLSYTEIRSPINGVVTDRPLFAGETAAAGAPVITVMDTTSLLAKLHISQMQAQQLSLGATAAITIPGVTEPVPAKVSLISPALDPGSTTVEVWLRLENLKGLFRAGTSVHTSITGRTANNALLIPALSHNRRFSADVSHELRTPLTILRGELEQIVQRPRLSARVRDAIGSSLEEIDRMRKIVENLLAIARLDSGTDMMNRQCVDLSLLARWTVDQLHVLAEEKQITMHNIEAGPALILADSARVKQVLVNLLDNAIKYTPHGGRIEVSIATSQNVAILEVRDTGIGIPPESLSNVFNRFYRSDKARSRESGGTGLGLSIVQAICNAHEGSVSIQSTEGIGTTVRLELPLFGPSPIIATETPSAHHLIPREVHPLS